MADWLVAGALLKQPGEDARLDGLDQRSLDRAGVRNASIPHPSPARQRLTNQGSANKRSCTRSGWICPIGVACEGCVEITRVTASPMSARVEVRLVVAPITRKRHSRSGSIEILIDWVRSVRRGWADPADGSARLRLGPRLPRAQPFVDLLAHDAGDSSGDTR